MVGDWYKIVAAARQANANEFICNLPKVTIRRWATEEFVFQGQRQRISIARAILCNPKFWFLMKQLMPLIVCQNTWFKEINTLSQNCTVIIIAHRLSTVEQADQIIVLEEGRVVEQGNFRNLIKLNGSFAKIYHLQYGSVQIWEKLREYCFLPTYRILSEAAVEEGGITDIGNLTLRRSMQGIYKIMLGLTKIEIGTCHGLKTHQ